VLTDKQKRTITSMGLILFNATAFHELLLLSHAELRQIRSWLDSTHSLQLAMVHAFEDALRIDYRSIFELAKNLLLELPASPSTEAALRRILEMSEMVIARAGLLRQDLSGRIYHSSLGKALAKNFATYYTRVAPGELLAWLGVHNWEDTVADFACGSGTLLTSCYHRKLALAYKALAEGEDVDAHDLHRRFIEEDILGMDAMSFAAHLTLVNLALQSPRTSFKDSRIYDVPVSREEPSRSGSLELLSSELIEVRYRLTEASPTAATGHSMDSTETDTVVHVPQGAFDVVIMNPPFSRKDRASKILDMSTVQRVVKGIRPDFSAEAGLASPFVLLGHLYVKTGGTICFVLPSAVASRSSWNAIREMLTKEYHVEYMIISWAKGRPAFSEESDSRELMIVARKLKKGEQAGSTMLVHLDRDLSFLEARDVATALLDAKHLDPAAISLASPSAFLLRSRNGQNVLGEVIAVPRTVLRRSVDNWYRFFAFRDKELTRLVLVLHSIMSCSATKPPFGVNMAPKLAPLSSFTNVMLYVKNVGTAGYRIQEAPTPESIPCLQTSAIGHIRPRDEEVAWLHRDATLKVSEPFKVRTAQLLLARRTDLYSTMRVAAVFCPTPTTGSMWLPVALDDMQSSDGEVITADEVGKVLAMWFNSVFGLVSLLGYRAETRGSFSEWKTKQMRRVHALDPSKLTRETIDGILRLWEEFSDKGWELLRTQLQAPKDPSSSFRYRFDSELAKILNNPGVDFDRLYSAVLRTLNKLHSVMETPESTS